MSGSSSIGDSPHGYAGIPGEEEIAEQGQSPDSQPQGRTAGTRSDLPPLAIPPRLKTEADEGIRDDYSPTTPTDEVMSRYADADNLPEPTSQSEDLTHFGSVKVQNKDAHHYMKVRQHMAMAPKGKKYLAVLENREDIKTQVIPYMAQDSALAGANRLLLQPATLADPAEKTAAVIFPVDRAVLTVVVGAIRPRRSRHTNWPTQLA